MNSFTKSLVYFGRAVKSEIRKSRKTIALWLTLLYPLLTVLLVAIVHLNHNFEDENPWTRFTYNISEVGAFFLPFYLVLIIGFYCHIENKSNTWKHLLTSPLPKWAIYKGKIWMILLMMMVSYFLFMIFTYGATIIMHLISKRMTFDHGNISFLLFNRLFLRMYLASFLLIAIQYVLSLRLKNLIGPIVIGIFMVILPFVMLIIMGISGMIKDPKQFQDFFQWNPYSYPFAHILNFVKEPSKIIQVFSMRSAAYFSLSILVLLLGYLDFSKRNIK